MSIPYYNFKRKLISKCDDNNIELIQTEESYTSKCSFIDNEPLKKQEIYLGKRIKRGLFQTKDKKLVNSDINGAANILRKVFPNFERINGIEAFIVKPKMLNIF